MSVILKNNVEGFLATAISASDTGLVLQAGNGANFPNPVSPDYFFATLVSSGGTIEVVKVTARSGDSMTIVRAQDGTTANSFAAGARVEMRVNAQSVIDTVYGITNYQGASAGNPTVRLDGSALQAGDFYFNTTADEVRFFNGTAWQSLTTGSIDVQNFSGNGSTTDFTLSTVPTGEDNTQVYVNGVYQQKNTYSISGTTLIFSVAPPSGATIEVVVIEAIAIGQTSSDLVSYQPAGVSAVPTTVREKLRETVSVKDFGAVGDGVTDDSTAMINALQSGAQRVFVPVGTYAMSSHISATIATDVTFYGHGTIIYTGATDNVNPLFTIETDNNSLTIDGLSFDGDDKIAAGLVIKNSATPDSNTLPNCTLSNNLLIRFRKNVAGIWSDGAYVSGSYQLVTIANNRVRLITRAAGTGVPGVSGTSGITVQQLSSTQFIRECLHYGNQYTSILGDDLVASANNVDYDGFKFFAPNPSTASGQYVQSTLTSYGNVYRNCRGRALKIQAIGTVRDETVIRDSDYNISGSSEINFQYGVGMVSNCQFIYRAYNGGANSPLHYGKTLVQFYQGADYGENPGAAIVNGLQVLDSIPTGVGAGIANIVGAALGFTSTSAPLRPLVSVSNVAVNKNAVTSIVNLGYPATVYGTLRLDNITVPELTWGAVATNGTDTNFDIVATNVLNVDGVATPANAKPFVTTTTGSAVTYGGSILGGMNQGFTHSYSVRSGVTDKGPLLLGGGLSDAYGNAGGAASVQSIALADDATHEFDARFYVQSQGMFAVSVAFSDKTQGLFTTGGDIIDKVAVPSSDLFEVSAVGTNPDVDGRFNMWYTGGKLNVKNRLGSTRVVTVMFIG